MKTFFLTIYYLVFPFILFPQIYDWGKQISTSGSQGWGINEATYNATDPLGNVILLGNTVDTAYFNGIAVAPDEGFLAKYSPDGVLLWGKSLSLLLCSANMKVAAVKSDKNGDIVVAYNCNSKFFIRKFDTQGNEIFTVESSGPGRGSVEDLAIGPNGEIHVAGILYDFGLRTDSLFLGGVGLPGPRVRSLFLYKLDESGNGLWGKVDQNTGAYNPQREYAHANRLTVDMQGNVYLMGITRGDLDFGNGVFLNVNSISNGEIFVVKFNTNGIAEWGKVSTYVGNSGDPDARGIEVDDDGNIYMSGNFFEAFKWDTLLVQNSGVRYGNFILCTDNQGSLKWMKHIEILAGYFPEKGGLAIGNISDEVYLMGSGAIATLDTFYLDYPNCGNFSGGNSRTHVASFDKNGNIKWFYGMPCYSPDQEDSWSTSISTDEQGGIYVSGILEHGVFSLDTLNSEIKHIPYVAKTVETGDFSGRACFS